jgi:hypothetical protein
MTRHPHLKDRIRARMDATGERYTTARRHVLNAQPPGDYTLLGGVHPDTAAIAGVLANRGLVMPGTGTPLSEAMILGIGGGLGAGYILWEFERTGRRVVVLGFRTQWQYPDRWAAGLCERLGVPFELRETGGRVRAEADLRSAIEAGTPVVAWIDTQVIGYQHSPDELRGYFGNSIAVYGLDDERGVALVDDRNTAPLTVGQAALAAARASIPSFKQRVLVMDAAGAELDEARLRAAVTEGIERCAAHLTGTSASFQLPAVRKWARMMTDTRNAKGWPRVFADGHRLFECLLSITEGVADGAHLRGLYAGFLDEAAAITGRDGLREAAAAYRELGADWEALAVAAAPAGSAPFAEATALGARLRAALRRGDAGQPDAAEAARKLWALKHRWREEVPLGGDEVDGLLAELHERLLGIYERETAAAKLLTA